MGLVIGITACCCAYCAVKKKRKQKRRRLADGQAASEENGLDADAEIPVKQDMIRGEVDDATDDELNVDHRLQLDGIQVGMDNDRPPPFQAASVPMGTVLEEINESDDTNIGGRKHSAKKVKYSHLSETAKVVDTAEGVVPETSNSDEKENSHVIIEGDAFMKEIVDKMAEIEEEGEFEGGSRKQSSKKYKYSPLKGSTSTERKRVKSGDSQKDHEEIRMSWSNDVYIDEPPTEV